MVFLYVSAVLAIVTLCLYLTRSYGEVALTSMFVALFVLANVLSNKLVVFAGAVVPAGIIVFSATFLMTDVLCEVYGKDAALRAVRLGLCCQILLLVTVRLAVAWPAPPFWGNQEAFELTLGNTSRLVVASILAYVCSQHHDVWAFQFWKRKTGGKHLWLRNNLSTMVSQVIDSAVFVTVAFYGKSPVRQILIGQIVAKLIIAAMDTPFIYLVRGFFTVPAPSASDGDGTVGAVG